MFKSCSIASFVECENTEHLQMLGAYNEMKFTDTNALKYKNHKLTTTEVLEYFDDLKLLGRSEYKILLKWRTNIRNFYNLQVAQAAPSGHLKNKASVALPLTAEELAKKAAEEEYDNSPEGHRVRLEELALDRLERLSKKKKT